MKIHISIFIHLLWLTFQIPNGIQGNDIYQKVIDELQFEDPRIPRKISREKVKEEEVAIDADESNVAAEKSSSDTENTKLLVKCQSNLMLAEQEKIDCMTKPCPSDGIPFFKQFIRSFAEAMKPLDGDLDTLGAKILLKKEQVDELQSLLKKQSNAKDILDLFNQYNAFQPLEPSISEWKDLLSQLNLTVVVTTFVILSVLLLSIHLVKRLFFQEINWRRLVGFVIFVGFLCSFPWEWYRMYRVALSKKTSIMIQDIPDECNPKDLNIWKSVSLSIRNTFTFGDDKCLKYQESLLVDALWEVPPLQAISVCISRFFFEPMKYFSAALGESFRLFFKEIPAQWQPFLFIALVVIIIFLIISCSGLKIESPFLKINVNPQPEIRYLPAPAPQIIPEHPALEHVENQQGMILGGPIQNVVENRGPDVRRRQLPKHLVYSTVEEQDSGIIEVSELLTEPRAAITYVENNNPESGSRPLEHQEHKEIGRRNVKNTTGLPTKSDVQPIQVTEDPSHMPLAKNAAAITHLENNPELVSKKASECQEPQVIEEANIIRNMPSESDYHSLQGDLNPAVENVQPLQEEENAPSVCIINNGKCGVKVQGSDMNRPSIDRNPHFGESSGSIVVPNDSSVFSMPLGTEQSIAEISETTEFVQGVSGLNPGINSSESLPETVGAGAVQSTEDGYLLINQ